MSCSCGGKASPVASRVLQQAFMARMTLSAVEEAVEWLFQPPDGVQIFVMQSGRPYRVRNAHETVVINRADRPELERLGYIASKEIA